MNDSPKATHYGVWILNEEKDVKIECYVMDTRERVLSLRGAARTMGLVGNGSQALARNLNAQWIAPFLSEGLKNWLEKANRNELPTFAELEGSLCLLRHRYLWICVRLMSMHCMRACFKQKTKTNCRTSLCNYDGVC